MHEATVGVWGLSFKAGTDDRRRSPAVDIVNQLRQRGATVRAYDPAVTGPVPEVDGDVVVCADPYDAATGADVVAVFTDWEELTKIDVGRLRSAVAAPRIVDARNCLDAASLRDAGFDYVGLGNP